MFLSGIELMERCRTPPRCRSPSVTRSRRSSESTSSFFYCADVRRLSFFQLVEQYQWPIGSLVERNDDDTIHYGRLSVNV